jgi:hypothetical protein
VAAALGGFDAGNAMAVMSELEDAAVEAGGASGDLTKKYEEPEEEVEEEEAAAVETKAPAPGVNLARWRLAGAATVVEVLEKQEPSLTTPMSTSRLASARWRMASAAAVVAAKEPTSLLLSPESRDRWRGACAAAVSDARMRGKEAAAGLTMATELVTKGSTADNPVAKESAAASKGTLQGPSPDLY